MPNPTQQMVHVNTPLTNISVAYLQDQNEFIADKVFPNVPVMKQSDLYFKYDKAYWFRTDARSRGVGQESAGSGFPIDTDSYYCDPKALHFDIDDQVRANQDSPISLDKDGALFVSRGLMLKKEQDWKNRYFTTSVWTGSSTGTDIVPGTLWDVAGSTPIDDIDTESVAMKEKTGFKPNVFIISDKVWKTIKNNADFLDRVKITQDKIVTTSLLATLLEVDKVLIAGAVQNTAAEGQLVAMSFVFGKDALLLYAAPRPSILAPSAGYNFSWKGYLGGNALGVKMGRIPMPHLHSMRIEGEMAYDLKIVSADLGVFFNGVMS